jgi:hypothetical protein
VTGPEREDFRELRAEMREGFRDINLGIKEVSIRVGSLELTRAESLGAAEIRDGLKATATSERRWRIGISVSVALAIVFGVANLIVNLGAAK